MVQTLIPLADGSTWAATQAPFSAADVRFLNSVANNVAINLQGTGASLQTFVEQVGGSGLLWGLSSWLFGFSLFGVTLHFRS